MAKKTPRGTNGTRKQPKRRAETEAHQAAPNSNGQEDGSNGTASPDSPGAKQRQTGCEDTTQQREELAAAQVALEDAKRKWEQDIQRRKAELEALVQELAYQRDQFIAERRELETQRKSLEDRAHQEPAAAPVAPTADARQDNAVYRTFREAPDCKPEQPVSVVTAEDGKFFERVAEDAPMDAASVIAKFQGGPAWHDEEADDASAETSLPADASTCDVGHGAEPAAEGGESKAAEGDEESIEQYMSRLLTRVRGSSTYDPETASPRREAIPHPPSRRQTATPPPAPSSPPAEAAAAVPERLTELPQRAIAPEHTSDLAAMRALANQSAKTAIDRHTRTRWQNAGRGKLIVTVCALVSAALLIWWAPSADNLANISAGLALSIAVFWGMQSVMILYGVRQRDEKDASQQKECNETYVREASTKIPDGVRDEEPAVAGAPD